MSGEGDGHLYHPMLNDLILSEVFAHLKPRELLICRSVCKKWNKLTIPLTRSKFIVKIDGNLGIDPVWLEEENTDTVVEFVEAFRKNQLGIPFASFRLGTFCATDEVGQEFLKMCGATTTEIDLSYGEPGDVYMVEDVSEILTAMPNLQNLTLPMTLRSRSGNIVKLFPDTDDPENLKPNLSFLTRFASSYCPGVGNKFCPTFVEEIISVAPNITDLYLDNCPSSTEPHYCTGLEVLSAIEKLGRDSTVQTLEIQLVKPEHFELLSKMAAKPEGLKLKKMKFQTYMVNPLDCVALFKDTLQSVKVEDYSTPHSFLELPRMVSLKYLSIPIPWALDTKCIDLSKIFPSLQELCLIRPPRPAVWNDCVQLFAESEPCLALQTLRLAEFDSMRVNAFNNVLTVFPNLTQLDIEVGVDGVEILRQIWTQMPKLKALSISGMIPGTEETLEMDSVITGISTEVLEDIQDIVRDLDKMTAELREETILKLVKQNSNLPSIRNLTDLRHLGLNVTGVEHPGREKSCLTNLSGYLGFYFLKQLKVLRMASCEISGSCFGILKAEVGIEFGSSTFSSACVRITSFPSEFAC